MRRLLTPVLIAAVLAGAPAAAQSRKTPRKAPVKSAKAAPLAPLKTITPDVKCPSLIGMGIKTVRSFCDVPAGRDAAQGIVITLPPHTGPGTLSFDLHARHLYSEDEMKRGKAYSRYRAVIGALTMTGELLDRGAVEAEFRTAADLFDRIGGGAGPGTFYVAFPKYRQEKVVAFFDYAHNDYAQFASESGLLGLALLGVFVALSLGAALIAQWRRRDPLMRGMSFACIMGTTAILIHSWVDFNLQIPANAVLFMVILALGWISLFHDRADSKT